MLVYIIIWPILIARIVQGDFEMGIRIRPRHPVPDLQPRLEDNLADWELVAQDRSITEQELEYLRNTIGFTTKEVCMKYFFSHHYETVYKSIIF